MSPVLLISCKKGKISRLSRMPEHCVTSVRSRLSKNALLCVFHEIRIMSSRASSGCCSSFQHHSTTYHDYTPRLKMSLPIFSGNPLCDRKDFWELFSSMEKLLTNTEHVGNERQTLAYHATIA